MKLNGLACKQKKDPITPIHPYIHPFSVACSGPGHRGNSVSRDPQTSLDPVTSSKSSKETELVPRQLRDKISPGSWVCPKASSWCDMSETLPLEDAWKASWPDAQITTTGSSQCRGTAEPITDDQAPYPITKGKLSHSSEEAHFYPLVFGISYYQSPRRAHDLREGKSTALPSDSALFTPWQTGITSASLQVIPHSVYQSLTPTSSYEQNHEIFTSNLEWANHPFPCPQIWRC